MVCVKYGGCSSLQANPEPADGTGAAPAQPLSGSVPLLIAPPSLPPSLLPTSLSLSSLYLYPHPFRYLPLSFPTSPLSLSLSLSLSLRLMPPDPEKRRKLTNQGWPSRAARSTYSTILMKSAIRMGKSNHYGAASAPNYQRKGEL